jgi:hypothetical protein
VVGAGGHLGVGVLHLRRGRGVHRTRVGLPLGRHLTQAVELPLDLVDDVPARRRIEARNQVRVALAVVGGLDPAHTPVHPAAECRHRVTHHPAQHVVGERVNAPVAVGHRQCLPQRINRGRFLLPATGSSRGGIGPAGRAHQVVRVDPTTARLRHTTITEQMEVFGSSKKSVTLLHLSQCNPLMPVSLKSAVDHRCEKFVAYRPVTVQQL